MTNLILRMPLAPSITLEFNAAIVTILRRMSAVRRYLLDLAREGMLLPVYAQYALMSWVVRA